MIGARVYADERGALPAMRPGDYGQAADGDWLVLLPDDVHGSIRDHAVTEHDDGTISVREPIEGWQLRRGVFIPLVDVLDVEVNDHAR